MNDTSVPSPSEKHPEEHSGVSRRSLLTGAGALALGGGALAGLVGCEDTTTPVAAAGAGGGAGIMGDPTAGGPVDPAGIPLARVDYPVTLPLIGDPVKPGEPERGGVLRVYNYADYLNPAVLNAFGEENGVKVEVSTFETLDEAFSKLSTGGLEFDVIFTTTDQISRLVGRKLLQPLNYDLIPNLRKNVWDVLQSPYYDVGPRYTVPYVLFTTGIGWRNDLVSYDPAEPIWDALWDAERYRGKVQLLNDPREAIGAALMRAGITNLNTENPAQIEAAIRDLIKLNDDVRVKVAINGYETLPTGRIVLGEVWSGDVLSAAISYLPKDVPATALSYVYQEQGGPIANDMIGIAAAAQKPVMAHRFLNYLLDADVALENFVDFVGYQPPIRGIDPASLIKDEVIPPNLANALVTPEAFASANAFLGLTVTGQRLWDRGWQQFRAG
ncbi:MAG: spermidine/putrescine ABC transporter substrate-binding protein [Gammaproteobacteria bacterium]|nr:spermidine/putrescine ABC transporter substrate-binding protein [Gammaproteobacteria bacterium]